MDIFALVVGCFSLGLIIRNLNPSSLCLTNGINKLIIYVLFPCVVLSTTPDIDFNQSAVFTFTSAWVIGLFVFIPLCLWLSRRLKISPEEEAVLILLSILGNTAFVGIAMVNTLLGKEYVPSAVLYDQLGSFMILATLGAAIVAVYSPNAKQEQAHESKANPSIWGKMPPLYSIVKSIISFPPFIALLISFFIPSSQSFGALLPILKWVGSAIVPLALIVIGLQIEIRVEPHHRKILLIALGLKMLILPALTFVIAMALNISNTQMKASVLQAAMPPMMTPAIMLIEARIAPRLTASILGIGTLASFITLPICTYLLNQIG